MKISDSTDFQANAFDLELEMMDREALAATLDGLHPGEIPIGAVKRRSLAIQLRGRLFKIGRIDATKAFVVQRGGVRLLYVSPSYSGYRYVARRLFASAGSGAASYVDYDHSLGRAIAQKLGFSYVLLLAVESSANRSHGHLERDAIRRSGIDLRKHCFVDERITMKWLGFPVPRGHSFKTYANAGAVKPQFSEDDLRTILKATGFGKVALRPGYLQEIHR
ncbi:hypothetical protein [Neorhizobium galegae]|uniref:hypothetical protein n=1 Tax=Neorhizobium galegae TaxID=399 RepID=UPI001F3B4947|nr:hypothetical protein [Neorhizobium galegae]UIK04771.1 hypothetical protein LZK81_19220 [Neorhizobium galegae]